MILFDNSEHDLLRVAYYDGSGRVKVEMYTDWGGWIVSSYSNCYESMTGLRTALNQMDGYTTIFHDDGEE